MAKSIGDRSAADHRFRFRCTIWTKRGGRIDLENVEKGSSSLYWLLGMVGCAAGLRKQTWKRWIEKAEQEEPHA